MVSLGLIRGSAGTGEAVRSIVTGIRASGSTVLSVDSLTNWPSKFIATSGTLLSDGTIDPASVYVFYGHKNLAQIIIDGPVPGYTDPGNSVGQVVVVKPTTAWADNLADLLAVTHNDDGTTTGWNPLSVVPTVAATNGNRSFDISFPGVDYTDRLGRGTRLRVPRTGTVATQSTLLNGTTQYYSKAAPAGMTFTNNFVVSAWVKINSIGTAQVIASRYNGTSGWVCYIENNGTVVLKGVNGGSGNGTQVNSIASVPVGRWVHLTAQLDMSTTTRSVTTNYVMFDGIDVPAAVAQTGTNPTSLIQAGNLEIGSWNGGLLPFGGALAQVAIFSAKLTQATARSYMSQTLLGTETSLISAYSFNNTVNDLNTTNANNLVANGAAVATNVDSPFNANGYAIIMTTPVFSGGNTTMTVQTPEGYPISSLLTLGTASYSSQKAPYGFPIEPNKWSIQAVFFTPLNKSGAMTGGTWLDFNLKMPVPVGAWVLSLKGAFQLQLAAGAATGANISLSETIGNSISPGLNVFDYYGSSNTNDHRPFYLRDFVTLTTATNYNLTAAPYVTQTVTNIGFSGAGNGNMGPLALAECAYL